MHTCMYPAFGLDIHANTGVGNWGARDTFSLFRTDLPVDFLQSSGSRLFAEHCLYMCMRTGIIVTMTVSGQMLGPASQHATVPCFALNEVPWTK